MLPDNVYHHLVYQTGEELIIPTSLIVAYHLMDPIDLFARIINGWCYIK